MSTDRLLHYQPYHQQTSRNVLAALIESDRHEAGGPGETGGRDDAGSAGLSSAEREPRAGRSPLPAERLTRSRDELTTREESEVRQWGQTEQVQLDPGEGLKPGTSEPGRRQMDLFEADRRRSARGSDSQERDAWRQNRRYHQSSHIQFGFGSASPRWEDRPDMGRRYMEFWSRPASPVTSRLLPRCTSSSQLEAAGQRATLDEEPSARRHRSDLTPTVPAGHSFRDPPPTRHRSSGSGGGSVGSRPSSAQSQQSGTPGGAVRPSPLRARAGARRPRPSSIAGMPSRAASDTAKLQTEESRVPSRSGSASTPRRPLPASAPTSEARRPPPSSSSSSSAAAAAASRRTPAQVKADDARKKRQRSRSGTHQSSEPGARPNQTASSGGSEHSTSPAPSGSSAEAASEQPPGGSTESPPRAESPVITVQSATPPSTPAPSAAPEVTDGGGPGGRRAGYDSEAAARAALAEKRRQAREEAERQAELERQRQEEEERQEQERLRQEELMMEEAARAEQERLQKAIQEAEERRAAEELQRQEEEQQRKQREEEEAAARLEAEKARQAAAEKLQREEAERKQRRSRVAAIMSRTRKSNSNNNDSDGADKTGDSEEETTGSMSPKSTDSKTEPAEENHVEPVSSETGPDTPPARHEDAPRQEQEKQQQEQESGVPSDSSPALTGFTNGTNGLGDGADPAHTAANGDGDGRGTDSDDGRSLSSTAIPPINSLALKTTTSDDEGSLVSNTSPQPGQAGSLGLSGGPPSEQLPVHTTEMVQL